MEKILRGISNAAASVAAKTVSSYFLPTWPAGAARRYFILEVAWYKQEGWRVWAEHPAIVNEEVRFHPVEAGTNLTGAERQRAGMREVSCLLPAPNSIKISD